MLFQSLYRFAAGFKQAVMTLIRRRLLRRLIRVITDCLCHFQGVLGITGLKDRKEQGMNETRESNTHRC